MKYYHVSINSLVNYTESVLSELSISQCQIDFKQEMIKRKGGF